MIEMSPNLTLLLVGAALVATGVYLLLERTLTRIIIGLALLSNGVNVLMLVAGGQAGNPPILGGSDVEKMSDPLPQAMILTAIVITLGITAFLLAMAYRSWQLHGHDEVQDDLEDRRVARRDAQMITRSTDDDGRTTADRAEESRDETDSEPGQEATQ